MTERLKELLRQKLETKANIEKYWNSNQNQWFEKLKLIKIETLGYYDVKDKTQVITDVSAVGLIQIDNNGPRVIAYGNRTFRKNEETEQRLRRNVIHLKRLEGQWKSVEEGNDSNKDNIKE